MRPKILFSTLLGLSNIPRVISQTFFGSIYCDGGNEPTSGSKGYIFTFNERLNFEFVSSQQVTRLQICQHAGEMVGHALNMTEGVFALEIKPRDDTILSLGYRASTVVVAVPAAGLESELNDYLQARDLDARLYSHPDEIVRQLAAQLDREFYVIETDLPVPVDIVA